MSTTAQTSTSRTAPRGRTELIETSITRKQMALLAKAAELSGTSVEEFVVQSAADAALRLVRDHEIIRLTARDQAALVKALLSPPKPVPALRAAALKYRKAMGK